MRTSELQIAEPFPYYKTYIDVLGDCELMDKLQRQVSNFPKFIESIPDSKMDYAYAEGKWTVAEVLLHIIDTERIFQYRALRFCRGDKTPLPGFDQDVFISGLNVKRYSKENIIEEYKIVRKSTIALFANLDRKSLESTGIASQLNWSVAALGFVICGHQRHHRNIIRERYL
ncbi:DinB family protein [Maribacter halichondriae]|uniref:DinB family protein n=1 Tax=Maribacter halichondriae TaxID=2980554 RepID=UPI00235996CA|nr:DinB family protein [Maribacter sp. Hal144]